MSRAYGASCSTEGQRRKSGGRAEVFTNWVCNLAARRRCDPLTEHRGKVEAQGQVIRERDGRLTISARATEAIREAVKAGKRFMSVEFRSIEERTTAGGVRELLTGRRGRGRARVEP